MWCAFVLNDAATATTAAIQLAGETTGRVLPAMLKPRDWDTMTPEERLKARNKVGLVDAGYQKCYEILPSGPCRLPESHDNCQTHLLQTWQNIADRLRVNAVEALKGLKVKTTEQQAVEYVDTESRVYLNVIYGF
eukprot:jgi/Picre1/27195/NNA_000164.t1